MPDGDRILPHDLLEEIQTELADLEAVQDSFAKIQRISDREHKRLMLILQVKLKKATAHIERLKKELARLKAR